MERSNAGKRRVCSAIGMILVLASAIPAAADLWRWTDDQGNVTITEDPGAIPPQYKDRATLIGQKREPAGTTAGARSETSSAGAAAQPGRTEDRESAVEAPGEDAASSRAYWEGRASEIRSKIKEEEDKLAEVKAARTWTNVNRYGQSLREMRTRIAESEKKIQDLKRQLTIELPAEAARAGASPAWVR